MKRREVRIIKDIPAFLFMVMLWRVLPAKTAAIFAGSNGESLAMGTVVILCVVTYGWYIFVRLHGKLPGGKALLVPIIGVLVFGASVLIHSNEWNTLYFSYYIRYVFFTLLFLLCVRDYRYLIDLFSKFALITFLILGWQPILSTNVFANWMDYGFTVALPCTIGLYVLAKKSNNIIYWILTIASLFLAIAFANRSTWLCIILFVTIYEFIIERGTVKKFGFISLALIAILVVTYNFEEILNWLIALNNRFNYNSHSLQKIKLLVSGTTLDVFMSGRQGLSQLALNEIQLSFPFGSGVGYFESKTGVYSHNIALDSMLYWGLLGIMLFAFALLGVVRSVLKEKEPLIKKLKIILLCLWFPKLFFSGSFTYDLAFWSSITLMIANPILDQTSVDSLAYVEEKRRMKNG